MVRFLAWLVVAIAGAWALASPGFDSVLTLVASLVTAMTIQAKNVSRSREIDSSSVIEECKKDVDGEVASQRIQEGPVLSLSKRFLAVFINHGIHLNEIPRCIPARFEVSLSDLSNSSKLIEKMTPDLIDWVCLTFNIRRSWLEADSERIYETENFYKNEHSLLRLLKDLKEKYPNNLRVIAYKDVGALDSGGPRPQNVNLLIAYPTLKLGKDVVMAYIPTSTQWDWGYWRSRYQLKGIIRTCYKRLGLTFDGYNLNTEDMSKLSSGTIFPKKVIDNTPSGIAWYPDDYSDTSSESSCAKETHETSSIIEYVREQRYADALDAEA